MMSVVSGYGGKSILFLGELYRPLSVVFDFFVPNSFSFQFV